MWRRTAFALSSPDVRSSMKLIRSSSPDKDIAVCQTSSYLYPSLATFFRVIEREVSEILPPGPPVECSVSVVDDEGVLISPGWPDPYDQQDQCTTVITAPQDGQVISLEFIDFDVS